VLGVCVFFLFFLQISQKTVIDMAAARGRYVCQSQSLNIFMRDVTPLKLSSMHFYAWKSGLKTGMYYLRSKAPAKASQVTLDPKLALEEAELMRDFNTNRGAAPTSAATIKLQVGDLSSNLSAEEVRSRRAAKQAEVDKNTDEDHAANSGACKGGSCSA